MKILIVGGGIAGATVALLLEKNFSVTLVEKAPQWRTIGYTIGLWSNGVDMLKKIGLFKKLKKYMYSLPGSTLFDKHGRKFLELPFPKGLAVSIPREMIHAAIHTSLTNTQVKFDTKVVTIKQDNDGVDVLLSDDTSEVFDLVIAADGMYSKTREKFWGISPLQDYGYDLFVDWLPGNLFLFNGFSGVIGSRETCIMTSYFDRGTFGIAVKNKNDSKRDSFILTEIQHPIQHILNETNPKDMLHTRLHYVSMKNWYKKRVVLIGDARHGHSPASGMGTSLALEDAFVLSEELNHTIKDGISVDQALYKFQKRRNQRLKKILIFVYLMDAITGLRGVHMKFVAKFLCIMFSKHIFNWGQKIFSEKI